MLRLGLPICSNKYQKWHLPRQGLSILKRSTPPYWLKTLKAIFLTQQEIMPVSINYKNNLLLIIEIHEPQLNKPEEIRLMMN
jgi:hypothetical protein